MSEPRDADEPGSRRAHRGGARERVLLRTVVVVAVLVTVLTAAEAFEEAELATVDARFVIRGVQAPPDDVVVVAVDEATLAATADAWPFPLDVLADAVGWLDAAGAEVIVVDVPFGPGEGAPGSGAFLPALEAAERVVLATARTSPGGAPAVLGGPPALAIAGVRAGDARFDPDDDGVVRRLDHTVDPSEDDEDERDERATTGRLAPGVVPSLAVVAAEAATGQAVPPSRFGPEGVTIDHPGPAGTVTTVSFGDVLDGSADPSLVAGRVAVVGPTAPALQDLFPTPLAERTSGTEIHAAAIATVLAGFPLAGVPLPIRLLVVAGVCSLPLAVVRRRTGPAVLGVAAIALVYLVAAQVAFGLDLLVPVLPVVVGLGAIALALVAAGYVFEARGGARALAVFARYVPAAVVRDAVRGDADEDLVRAVDRDVTVLFGDLRGFTSLSERRGPDEVVRMLNDYLSAMADIVMAHGGIVTGYLGDGIMAVFGVPDALPDHADRALAAAAEMLERLDRLAADLAPELDGERLRMGIGLNSGPVTAGNLGSEQRLEYSVVGDTVNTASRIEGQTKASPFDLLLADATRARLQQLPDDLVEHATVPLRGRDAEVTLWSLERTRRGEGPGPAAAR